MDFPFHGMTETEREEIIPYIQGFIDICRQGERGSEITIYCAYNLSSEMFAINFCRPTDEFVNYKWIYRGEEGKRKYEERIDREISEEYLND